MIWYFHEINKKMNVGSGIWTGVCNVICHCYVPCLPWLVGDHVMSRLTASYRVIMMPRIHHPKTSWCGFMMSFLIVINHYNIPLFLIRTTPSIGCHIIFKFKHYTNLWRNYWRQPLVYLGTRHPFFWSILNTKLYFVKEL